MSSCWKKPEWFDWPEQERIEYPFCWELAPDVLHKMNVSGGAPFRIALPALGADGIVEDAQYTTATWCTATPTPGPCAR